MTGIDRRPELVKHLFAHDQVRKGPMYFFRGDRTRDRAGKFLHVLPILRDGYRHQPAVLIAIKRRQRAAVALLSQSVSKRSSAQDRSTCNLTQMLYFEEFEARFD